MLVVTEHDFEAAHRLPGHPGACANLHGHHYRFEVQVAGSPDSQSGMVIDFAALDRLVHEKVIQELDHRDLNEVLPNPTAEAIVGWIWRRLVPCLDGLALIRLWETPRYSVICTGDAPR